MSDPWATAQTSFSTNSTNNTADGWGSSSSPSTRQSSFSSTNDGGWGTNNATSSALNTAVTTPEHDNGWGSPPSNKRMKKSPSPVPAMTAAAGADAWGSSSSSQQIQTAGATADDGWGSSSGWGNAPVAQTEVDDVWGPSSNTIQPADVGDGWGDENAATTGAGTSGAGTGGWGHVASTAEKKDGEVDVEMGDALTISITFEAAEEGMEMMDIVPLSEAQPAQQGDDGLVEMVDAATIPLPEPTESELIEMVDALPLSLPALAPQGPHQNYTINTAAFEPDFVAFLLAKGVMLSYLQAGVFTAEERLRLYVLSVEYANALAGIDIGISNLQTVPTSQVSQQQGELASDAELLAYEEYMRRGRDRMASDVVMTGHTTWRWEEKRIGPSGVSSVWA